MHYKFEDMCNKLKENNFYGAVNENGDIARWDNESKKIFVDLKNGKSLDLSLNWTCYENLRDKYWIPGNKLICRNENEYSVIDDKHAEFVAGDIDSMDSLYKYCFDRQFDYGVNKEWNIKTVITENEIIDL